MASNIRNSNTFYVTTSSTSADSTSYISDKNLKLIGVIYHVNASTDTISIYDKSSTQAAAGLQKLTLIAATAKDSTQFRLPEAMVFPNGVWVTLSGSPTATLIFTPSLSS